MSEWTCPKCGHADGECVCGMGVLDRHNQFETLAKMFRFAIDTGTQAEMQNCIADVLMEQVKPDSYAFMRDLIMEVGMHCHQISTMFDEEAGLND